MNFFKLAVTTTFLSIATLAHAEKIQKESVYANAFSACFREHCDGCKIQDLSIDYAKQRGDKLVVRARVKYDVCALLGCASYTKYWRVEMIDDVDRYSCVEASYE